MLVLIVGSSGAGKDTLLLAARDHLAGDHRFRFVRRVVTRPPGMLGEEYDSLTPQEFELVRESGGFASSPTSRVPWSRTLRAGSRCG